METETAETEAIMMAEEGLATAEQFEALPSVEDEPLLAHEAQESADMLEMEAEESRPIEERIRENATEFKGGEHWQVTYQSTERYAHDEETNEVLNARTGESLTRREFESGDPRRVAFMQDLTHRIEQGERGFRRLDDVEENHGDEKTIHVTYVILGEDREVSYLILSTTVRITGEEGSIELTEANRQHLPFLWEREADEHPTEIQSADVEPLVYAEAVTASETEETESESEEIARAEVMEATPDIETLRADESVTIETPPRSEAQSEKSEVVKMEIPPQETRIPTSENNEITRSTTIETSAREVEPAAMRNTAHAEHKAEGVVYTPVETRAEIEPAMLKELLASEAPLVADRVQENARAFAEPQPVTQTMNEPERVDMEHHNAAQKHSPEKRVHEETELIVREVAPIRIAAPAEHMPSEIRIEPAPQTEKESEEKIVIRERTVTEVFNIRSEIPVPEGASMPVQENTRATERYEEQQPILQSADVLRELDMPLSIPKTPNAIETIRSGTPRAAHANAPSTDEENLSPIPIPTPIAERNGIRMFAVSGR